MLKGDPSKPGGIEIEWSIKLVACVDDGNIMIENMEEQNRQCTYKIEARSCNHSCSRKAISITYCECVCGLSYAHVPYCHLLPALLYSIFPHPIRGTIFFGGGGILNTKCVF
jgi:hypothetical protein